MLKRIILLILAINVIVYSVFLYYGSGSYVVIGYYDDIPVLQYRGDPEAVVLGFILLLYGLYTYYVATHRFEWIRYVYVLGLIVLIVSLLFVGFRLIYSGTVRYFYGGYTDAYALQVKASELLVHGYNPYAVNFHDYLEDLLREGRIFATVTWIYRDPYPPFRGDEVIGFVDVYDYPGAALLYYVPSILLGIPPIVWDGLVYGIGLGLMYYRFKEKYRLIYPLILLTGGFVYLVLPLTFTGLPGWITPMIIAILYPGNPWVAGSMLAWMISYRPYTGVYAIFYLLAYWREGYDTRRLILSGVLSGLLINGFFLLLNPVLFIERILAPLTYNLYPFEGFGFSSLYYLGLNIPKTLSLILLSFVFILLIALTIKRYKSVKYMVFIFPLIVLIFYYRPLYGYYIWAPLYAVTALFTGFYRGLNYSFPSRVFKGLNVVGLFNIIMAAIYSGYLEILGILPLTDFSALIVLLILPLIIYMVHKGIFPIPSPRIVSILIVFLAIVGSFSSLWFYSDQFMVIVDRDKYSNYPLLVYESVKLLGNGSDPYLGGIVVPDNTTRILVYNLTNGVRLVTSYPSGLWSWLLYYCGNGSVYGLNGACFVEFYTGFPDLLLFYSPLVFLRDYRLYNMALLIFLLIYLYYRYSDSRHLLFYVLFTGLPFYILAPYGKSVYTWFILLVFIVEAIRDLRYRLITYGFLSSIDLLGLLYSLYRIRSSRINYSYVMKYYVPVILISFTLPLLYNPYMTFRNMFLPYSGLETIYGYNLPLLLARYVLNTVWVNPLIPLTGVILFFSILICKRGVETPLWIIYPLLLIPGISVEIIAWVLVNTWFLKEGWWTGRDLNPGPPPLSRLRFLS